ncbi:MAG: 50S ribosomal protein L19 [Patescibacteria group bacterium]
MAEKQNLSKDKDNKAPDNAKEEKGVEKKKERNKDEKCKIPDLKSGMTVVVYQKIKELNIKGGEKERIQHFEGLIIATKHGKEPSATITVRKISNGIGVEKIFPLSLPTITKIEIKRQAKVRRAKLYFLKRGHKKKLKEKKKS